MKKIILFILCFSLVVSADRADDLFGENQEATQYIKSFRMDCSSDSPLCTEREEALRMENRFNEIFSNSLSRNIHKWPNNEILRVEEALDLRKTADNYFSSQFFGRASDSYKAATEIIFETLVEADKTVAELIELGEQYLYEDGKPDWATPYFNDAAPYDPENQQIINGLARIRFLRSFDDDVKSIEGLLLAGDNEEALSLIDETMRGDPGNKTLLELREEAVEGAKNTEIKILRSELNSVNYDLTLEEKREKLIKMKTSISLYGEEDLGEDIQDSMRILKDQILTEELVELKEKYINDPSNEIETTYQKAKTLTRNNPDKKELQDLFKQITETRNNLRLDKLKTTADELRASENWGKANKAWQEINMIEKSEEAKKQLFDIKNIISLSAKIKQIDENFKNQKDIDAAKKISNELKVYSNESTPKLNKKLIEFDSLIDTYQILVSEAEESNKRKKTRASKTKSAEPKSKKSASTKKESSGTKSKITQTSKKSSANQISNLPSSESNSLGISKKSSLIMSSFSKAVRCTKRIRNKKLVAKFEISVSSNGRPNEVILTNEEELNLSSRTTKDAVEVVKNALLRSRYIPALAGDVYVESVLLQRLVIPAGFCQN